MAKKIYLSPSNQNNNTYAYGDTNEMIQCNKIASYAKTALERCGFSVKKAAQGQSMYTSVSESNSWSADLHIPIHTNAANGQVTGGTLVMLYTQSGDNLKAGKAILNAVAPITPGSDYAIQTNASLYELSSTSAVAVYLECEFHDTETGAKFIVNNVKNLGEAIAKGVCAYFNVYYKPDGGSVTKEMYRVRKSSNDAKSQIGAFTSLENAKKLADQNSGYSVYNSSGKLVYAPNAGTKKLELKDVPLYVSSTATEEKKKISGAYYLWSAEEVNGRVKITNSEKNIGVSGQVTGWIDKKYTE